MVSVKLVLVGQENVGKSFLASCVKQTVITGKKKCKQQTTLPSTKGIDRDSIELKVTDFESCLVVVVELRNSSVEHNGLRRK